MYRRADFGNKVAEKALSHLKEQYKFTEDMSVTEISDILMDLKKQITYFEGCPLFVTVLNYYTTKEGKFAQAHLHIRPSKKETTDKDLSRKIVLSASETFFADFVEEVAKWVDYFIERKQMSENIQELNKVVLDIIEENEIPYIVQFEISDITLPYIDDNKTVYGVSEETAKQLSHLALFNKNDVIAEMARERLLTALLSCERGTDLRKMKMDFVEDIGIRTRKTLCKLVKQSVKRSAKTQRIGLGYIKDEKLGCIGIVKKEPVTEKELADFYLSKNIEYTVVKNNNLTVMEKKEGKTKILITYLLTPYNEETGQQFNIPLKDLFDEDGNALFEVDDVE